MSVGWGWFASAIALFSRETTLIFGLTMFAALLLFEGDRRRGVIGSVGVLGTACLAYLVLRIEFTTGYEHQIDPSQIGAHLTSLEFPHHFFIQLFLSQALLVLLLLGIAMRELRYAACLLLSAAVIGVVAIGTAVTDVGILLGETLLRRAVRADLAGDRTAAGGRRCECKRALTGRCAPKKPSWLRNYRRSIKERANAVHHWA
jgi:hypothetical protein